MCRILIYGCQAFEKVTSKTEKTTLIFCKQKGDIVKVETDETFATEILVSHDILPDSHEFLFMPSIKDEHEEVIDLDQPHEEYVEAIAPFSTKEESELSDFEFEDEDFKPDVKPKIERKKRSKSIKYDYIMEDGRVKCNLCPKTLKTRRSYRSHMRLHRRQQFLCDICSKTFVSVEKIRRHMRVHTGEKEFLCDLCSKSFDYRHNLEIHMRSHTKERPYRCHLCPKTYTTQGNLNFHVQGHGGLKSYVCEICGKAWSRKRSLKAHLNTHNEQKLFKCELCAKEFSHPSCKNRHMKVHTGEKKHQCTICSKAFARRDHAQNHMQLHVKWGKEQI
ncbi:gastrula zinc finger protein XlCGF7.1-like [Phlebotomus papatasi]|uniref:gastrula zinc finger protein XlCGF7.1-like n=1 Tax=Phlebotomus papatasi TaxID=29031 RepID=UPI0024840C50|nr:gastrula zinc finger protein XlCGF7.1-like [Phlebotomus papatasi]